MYFHNDWRGVKCCNLAALEIQQWKTEYDDRWYNAKAEVGYGEHGRLNGSTYVAPNIEGITTSSRETIIKQNAKLHSLNGSNFVLHKSAYQMVNWDEFAFVWQHPQIG